MMLRLIVFAVIIIWIIVRILKKIPNENFVGWAQPTSPKLPGKKYSWAWMQTAGALGMKFVRPEAANGYPAITGTRNGIEIMVQCLPTIYANGPVTMFAFLFPQPAQIGLRMLLADRAECEAFSKGKKSLSLQELFNERKLTDYYLEVRNPELLKQCFPREFLDRLGGMSVIYPWILLTDSEFQVRTMGIREDAVDLQHELTVLQEIVEELADFARKAAARSVISQPFSSVTADHTASENGQVESNQPEPETEKEPEPPAPEPETKITQEPVPAPADVRSSGPADKLEKSAFIQSVWSSSNAAEQKQSFEKHRGSEVEWSGVLKSFYPFTSDFTFGSKPGVKAVFELEEFKPERSFMPVKIKAVAAFPKETAESFAHAYGKNFSFRGHLLKLEPIAREIYIADACLSENGDQI